MCCVVCVCVCVCVSASASRVPYCVQLWVWQSFGFGSTQLSNIIWQLLTFLVGVYEEFDRHTLRSLNCASWYIYARKTNKLHTVFPLFVSIILASTFFFFSHSYRASWYYQSCIYSPTDALVSCLKNNIKIYIKKFLHILVLQLHHHQGARNFSKHKLMRPLMMV